MGGLDMSGFDTKNASDLISRKKNAIIFIFQKFDVKLHQNYIPSKPFSRFFKDFLMLICLKFNFEK